MCVGSSLSFKHVSLPPVSIPLVKILIFCKLPSHLIFLLSAYIDMTYQCVCIYHPLCSSRMGHEVNFFSCLTGLNSEFSFSETSCLHIAKEPSLLYYFTHNLRENSWIHTSHTHTHTYIYIYKTYNNKYIVYMI